MGAWIEIRKNATGEVRRYRDDNFDPDPEQASIFLWQDGNFSCDCNRAIFFAQAGEEDDEIEQPCGETAFSVIRAICDDGLIIQIDDVE